LKADAFSFPSVAPEQQKILNITPIATPNLLLPYSNQTHAFETYTWSHRCGNRISLPPTPGAIMRTLSTLFAATFAAAFVLSSLVISAATPPARRAKHGR
jgi:hypothetical protein